MLNNEKGELEDLLTGDNLIGQLLSFSRSLLESVFKYVETVRQKAVDAAKLLRVTGEEKNEKDPAKQAARSKILRKGMSFYANNSAHIDIVRND